MRTTTTFHNTATQVARHITKPNLKRISEPQEVIDSSFHNKYRLLPVRYGSLQGNENTILLVAKCYVHQQLTTCSEDVLTKQHKLKGQENSFAAKNQTNKKTNKEKGKWLVTQIIKDMGGNLHGGETAQTLEDQLILKIKALQVREIPLNKQPCFLHLVSINSRVQRNKYPWSKTRSTGDVKNIAT